MNMYRVQLLAKTCNDQGVYQPTIDHYNVYKTLPQTTDANGTVFPPRRLSVLQFDHTCILHLYGFTL